MKFSHLFTATSALLCTSAVVVVSAKRIGAPSSVLIEDSASGDSGDSDSRNGSQDTDYNSGNMRYKPDIDGSRDQGYKHYTGAGTGTGRERAERYNSKSRTGTKQAESDSRDNANYYYEDFFATENFIKEDTKDNGYDSGSGDEGWFENDFDSNDSRDMEPSSVLIKDSASGDSGDSDSRKGSQDTDYDSGDVGGYRDHGPLDSSDGPSHNNMFIAAGDSSKGHCVGRGWNTCDRRSPECKWIGNQNDGYCVDNTPNNGGGDDSSFDDGLREGQKTANNLWYSMGNDCANAWKDFETRINREVRDRGWDRSGNWRTQAFNEGAKAGMQKVLQEKSKQCLHDSSYECIDLGNEAARIIAFRYCHPNLYSTNNINKWKKECRDVAIGQCQGQVATKLSDDCGLPNTSTLKTLQNNCSDQVKTMIGEYTEELFVLEG